MAYTKKRKTPKRKLDNRGGVFVCFAVTELDSVSERGNRFCCRLLKPAVPNVVDD